MEPILAGRLSIEQKKIVWQGAWYTQQQRSADQSFRYTSQAVTPSPLPLSPGSKLQFQGHFYMLDAKQKRIQVAEKKLEIEVLANNMVRGSGTNRFGRFEFGGHVADGNFLQIKRTYLPATEEEGKKTRRSAAPAPIARVAVDADYLPEVQTLLHELRKKDKSRWFAEPVNASLLGLENYYHIISQPMDFSTMEKKLASKAYGTEDQEAAIQDLRLIFTNAQTFNAKGTLVHRLATELLFHVETRVKYMQKSREQGTKRVRVAKKFFQHVEDVEIPALPVVTVSYKPRAKKQEVVVAATMDDSGFDSFDELDELSDFEVEAPYYQEGGGDLTDTATPASGGELSPCPCFSPPASF